MKRAIVSLLVLAVLLGVVLVSGQSRLAPAFFDFAKVTEFTGRVTERPYPMLQDAEPRPTGRSMYVLVAPGRFGADGIVTRLDAHVRFRCKKIYRESLAMSRSCSGSCEAIRGRYRVEVRACARRGAHGDG